MSANFYDALADDYESHFAVPHRAAYDQLAWESVSALLPEHPATVIDAGCGVGRWAERLVGLGHRVVAIEQAPRMADAARRRLGGAPGFTLVEGDLATIDHPALTESVAQVVLAMGSIQYTADPGLAIERLASWTCPGGAVAVLVDSLVALALELCAAGRAEEAEERLATRRGVWVEQGIATEMHLFDRVSLGEALGAAGLVDVEVRGLLIGSSIFGRTEMASRLAAGVTGVLADERRLSAFSPIADAGKQLLATGRRR